MSACCLTLGLIEEKPNSFTMRQEYYSISYMEFLCAASVHIYIQTTVQTPNML